MFCLVSIFYFCLLSLATSCSEFVIHQIFKTIPAVYLQKTKKNESLEKQVQRRLTIFKHSIYTVFNLFIMLKHSVRKSFTFMAYLSLKFHHVSFNFQIGFIQFFYFLIQVSYFFITLNTCIQLKITISDLKCLHVDGYMSNNLHYLLLNHKKISFSTND